MFITLEESTIEETRLELAYEEARERGDFRQAAELAEARYFLQRLHAERLQHLIDNYKPEFTSRTWGNDPEYALMVKQLNAMMNEPITSDGANTNQGGAGGGGKVKYSSCNDRIMSNVDHQNAHFFNYPMVWVD
eukprot:scaffold300_cov173-Ochromonas_danica.AAC.14